MGTIEEHFYAIDKESREIGLFTCLIPPPVSLDALCFITQYSPVKTLQVVEGFVKTGHLLRDDEKGAGYYCLSDVKRAPAWVGQFPPEELALAVDKAVKGLCRYYPDGAKRWLGLANVYQVSGLPVRHFKELIHAGHYCTELNLPAEAAVYYQMALEGMLEARTQLDPAEKEAFIDGAIGVCTCKDSALSPYVQRRFLGQALMFCRGRSEPAREIRLRTMVAKTYIKTDESDEAARQLKQAWDMLENAELSHELKIQVALAYSELLFWKGFVTRAIERYESVITDHEQLPNDVETLKGCIRLGWTYGVAGETARGLGLIRTVRNKARELGAKTLELYATLYMVILLSDAGRIEEGEVFLDEVFQAPEDQLDNYIRWPGNGKRAFFAYCRGDYEKSFYYLGQAWENSKALETPHQRGPDNLEFMLGLEELGMVHPEWNFDTEIERLLNWPDIYMKGVGYRFRALKSYRHHGPSDSVKDDLKKSLVLLTRAGAKIELSHAQVLMARVRLGEKNIQAAEKLLKSAWEVFSKVNPKLMPQDLQTYLDPASKNALWVDSLLQVGDALGSIRTRRELLGQIIKQAMRLAGAERGAIFLQQGRDLEIVATRNIETREISSNHFSLQMKVIKNVFKTGSEIIRKASLIQLAKNINQSPSGWTGCFPIQLKARTLGVLFMDCGLTRLQLPDDEVSLLRIICNQAAVALANLEAYEEILDLNNELEAETLSYRAPIEPGLVHTKMIGRTPPFEKMLGLIRQVAGSDSTVMITGETGVGKDLVAQAIHRHSKRSGGPFIAVNVVSLSPELIASELFGHEKGAFTGASGTRKGRFELASDGTLFLDDIDAFSLDIQAKMLRVLEAREFERVGGTRTLKTRFRLVAASNRNIEDLVDQGLFRSDFYFRLNVFPIRVPPLRERKDDIPLLGRYFMDKFCRKFEKKFDQISRKDLEMLMNYHWPGNIRELRHVIERAVLLSSNGRLVIPPLDGSCAPSTCVEESRILPLKQMETQHILAALSRCRGKVSGPSGAAELLEIKPTTLHSKMKRLGIKRDTFQVEA